MLNQFLPIFPFWFPLETVEYQKFSYVFKSDQKGALGKNGQMESFIFVKYEFLIVKCLFFNSSSSTSFAFLITLQYLSSNSTLGRLIQ